MKKITALFLAFCMAVMPTFAMAESGMAEVLKIVKERIGSTEEYTDFASNSHESDGKALYSFSWQKDKSKYERLYITVTDTGIITSYNDDDTIRPEYGIKFVSERVDLQTAMDSAKTLIDKLNPQLAGELVIEQPPQYNSYGFGIKRVVNGLPVANDGGSVELDKTAGKIVSFHLNITENVEFLPAENLISYDVATSRYASHIGIEMEYAYRYKYDKAARKNKREMYLQYTGRNDEKINAVTGEVLVPYSTPELYRNTAMSGGGSNAKQAETAMDAAFSRAELSEIEAVENTLPKEELEKIAQGVLGEAFKMQSFNLQKVNYYDDIPVKYIAYMGFERKDGEKAYYGDVEIDAKTGEIKSFYKMVEPEEGEAVSVDIMKDAAEKTAKSLSGAKFDEYKLDYDDEDMENGIFKYTRYVDYVKAGFDTVRINVNKYSGDVTNYRINYTETEFVSKEGVISPNMALKAFFTGINYDKIYVRSDEKTMTPVYDFIGDTPLSIDAFTGERLQNGRKYSDGIYKYDDIENHYARMQIEALAEFGYGFSGKKFNPDSAITQQDFMTLLTGETENAYDYVDFDEAKLTKNEAAPITKEDAAKILMYRMSSEVYSLANEDIFKSPFADVTENIGIIAILKGKKIISGDTDGNFYPKQELTRANAAIMVYNFKLATGR